MKNLELPSVIQEVLDQEDLTVYGASLLIGAETDEPVKTIHERLSAWLRKTPKTWENIVIALDALGYQIKIEKKNI